MLRLQLHVEALVRELVDKAFRTCGGSETLEVVGAEFLIGLASRDNVVDDDEQRMGQRHDCHPCHPRRPV